MKEDRLDMLFINCWLVSSIYIRRELPIGILSWRIFLLGKIRVLINMLFVILD